jgi:hypothetical protein
MSEMSIAQSGCCRRLHIAAGQVVVVDESHSLRTTDRAPDSRNTEAAAAAVKTAKRAVLLSGTPSLSRPYDLFRQVRATPDLAALTAGSHLTHSLTAMRVSADASAHDKMRRLL